MLSVSSGYSPDYLLKEVATGRENYYTGAVSDGEPPGRWWGSGAEALGLTGLVEAQDMRALYERFLDPRADGFADPTRWDEVPTLGHSGRRYTSEDDLYAAALEREPGADAERRAELRTEAGKVARHNVAFLDVTFSVQKSVTLLHTAFEAEEVKARAAGDEDSATAWGQYRQAVEDAIWSGNNAALSYLSDHAGYARVGHHGGVAGRWVDSHDWVVTSFFQHDSRDHDPQLHIHNPVLNRVQGPDGEWRTLDSRAIHKFRAAAAAVAERTTEERLTRTVGVRFATRPDGKAREVVGVDPEAMDLVSTRRHAVSARAAELIDAFELRHGRAPNGLERDRLARQATLATRAAKSHDGETREQLLDRVDATVRAEVTGGLRGVAEEALASRPEAPEAMSWSPAAVIETALADVQSKKAGWTRADLTRSINDALPDHLGLLEATDIATFLDSLTDHALELAVPLDPARPGDAALPDALRLRHGQSAYDAPGARLYATPEHVHTERAMVAATTTGGAAAVPGHVADRFVEQLREAGVELGVDQAAAVRGVLTSGARVESLVGPAGTGKSFVVGTLARAWSDPCRVPADAAPRRVFGLAASQVATNVLTAEGLTACNVTRWLGSQDRLASRHHGLAVPEDEAWRLRAGDLVVVDESAMTDTAALAAIHAHADAAGAKLLLVGDHRQLAAVGAGGGMDLLATSGSRYELTDARRFAAEWERGASLRLRAGDEAVLREYHQHGRILDAGTRDEAETSAATAWLADTLAGRRSLLLVDMNEQADRLSAVLRAELVRLGRVDEAGVALATGTFAGVGDVIQARRNGWELIGHEGNRRPPINRETYTVTGLRDDGSLEVRHGSTGHDGAGERMVLPADYVADHVALAYASTVHAAQGATVDSTHSVVTGSTGPAALYVGMSRGRNANTAHVATVTEVDDPARGTERHRLHRDPVATLAGILDTSATAAPRSAVATATESAEEAGTTRTAAELLADAAQLAAAERTAGWLDQLTAEGVLGPKDRAGIAAEDGTASLTRILRRAEIAGHDPRQVLHDAIADRPLDGARNLTNVVHGRIRDEHTFDPVGDTWSAWTPRTDNAEWNQYLTSLATAADLRAQELGEQLADNAPAWLIDALGPVPATPDERDAWQDKAAAVAAYRESRGYDVDDDALGPAPAPGQAEAYAAYRAAWRALGRPDIDREELELSDGQLRVRVRAYDREAAWAPRYVGNELAGTRQAADHARQNEQLRRAEALAVPDDSERTRLIREAEQAAALAGTLDQRAEQLHELDDARSRWLVHTSGTRAAAERSKAELAARHIDDTEPERLVTAEEWLAAHRQALDEDEPHREITEADLDLAEHDRAPTEHTTDEDRASQEAGERPAEAERRERTRPDDAEEPEVVESVPVVESPDLDIREEAVNEPAPVAEDDVRVPSAEETAAATERAHRALAEMRARESADVKESEEHRVEELTRWHADDERAAHHMDDADDSAEDLADVVNADVTT
ncbi:MobF family relaxase [Actinomycetospora lemnae]|uniref:MobF family relaxase n=1 Tax=Actinomycetospora lemnae TaxID=3019891 RepID=A0ABT5T096_9PSEU|nr:MobF family relaxase [Actinomycetospora sp. DW7H6]MDD7968439.1 MobF family relaxase [Actinomycetospora sp. DW7H6]